VFICLEIHFLDLNKMIAQKINSTVISPREKNMFRAILTVGEITH